MMLAFEKQLHLYISNPSLLPKTDQESSNKTGWTIPFQSIHTKLIKLLCIGYMKIYISHGIDDISSIILKYLQDFFPNCHINDNRYSQLTCMSDYSILCNFQTSNSRHTNTSVIFTPYINDLFDFDNAYSNNNNTNHKNSDNHNKKVQKCQMKVTLKCTRLINNDMLNTPDAISGYQYCISCGILCIPKNIRGTSLDEISRIYSNYLNSNKGSDCDAFFIGECNNKYNDNNNIKSKGIRTMSDEKDINSYYLHLNYEHGIMSQCRIHKNGNGVGRSYGYRMKKNNNSVDVCIRRELINDNIDNNVNKYEYTLFFYGGEFKECFGSGMKLDGDKYDWLFAITSQSDQVGYKFHVQFESPQSLRKYDYTRTYTDNPNNYSNNYFDQFT